jgi:hypothetical protein
LARLASSPRLEAKGSGRSAGDETPEIDHVFDSY